MGRKRSRRNQSGRCCITLNHTQLWVSDFTYVSTWQGWLYVALVIDVFARYIVGWQVSTSMRTDWFCCVSAVGRCAGKL